MITKVVLFLAAMSRFLLRAMYPRGLAPRKLTHVSERVFFRERGVLAWIFWECLGLVVMVDITVVVVVGAWRAPGLRHHSARYKPILSLSC